MTSNYPAQLKQMKPMLAVRCQKIKGQNGITTAVVGIVEKKKSIGKLKAFTTKHADATVALSFLSTNIIPGSILHTDDSRIYARVKRDFDHELVDHSKQEYVRAGVHTNTIEGFWGQLQRSIDGTYHCVSPKYL
jgi:hypothetical protein